MCFVSFSHQTPFYTYYPTLAANPDFGSHVTSHNLGSFSQGKRENIGNEVACSNNLCSVYSYKQELYEIQNFINKKKSFVILRTSWYRGSLCRGSSVYKFQIFSSLWTGSLFGEINSKESSPLDQRPVHRLNSYCCLYWIYLLKIFSLLDLSPKMHGSLVSIALVVSLYL